MEKTKEEILARYESEVSKKPFTTVIFSLGLVFIYANKKMLPQMSCTAYAYPSNYKAHGYIDNDLNATPQFDMLLNDLEAIEPNHKKLCVEQLSKLLTGLHLTYKYSIMFSHREAEPYSNIGR